MADLEKMARDLADTWFFLAQPKSGDVLAVLHRVQLEERERCAKRAIQISEDYPQGSDGRNTFVMFADWIRDGRSFHRPYGESLSRISLLCLQCGNAVTVRRDEFDPLAAALREAYAAGEARGIAAERERCSGIADAQAAETLRDVPADDIPSPSDAAAIRAARRIRDAIRAGQPLPEDAT